MWVRFGGKEFWGSPEFLSTFVGSVVDRVSVLQERLRDLDDPQVELHLLRSCLGVCKLNHLLRTIPPGSVDSELQRFDDVLPHMRISAHSDAYGTSHTRMGYPVRVWVNIIPRTRMGVPYEYMDNCVIYTRLPYL